MSEQALSVLIDVQYAIRQLREFRDVGRALDALERVEEALQRPAEDESACPHGWDHV